VNRFVNWAKKSLVRGLLLRRPHRWRKGIITSSTSNNTFSTFSTFSSSNFWFTFLSSVTGLFS